MSCDHAAAGSLDPEAPPLLGSLVEAPPAHEGSPMSEKSPFHRPDHPWSFPDLDPELSQILEEQLSRFGGMQTRRVSSMTTTTMQQRKRVLRDPPAGMNPLELLLPRCGTTTLQGPQARRGVPCVANVVTRSDVRTESVGDRRAPEREPCPPTPIVVGALVILVCGGRSKLRGAAKLPPSAPPNGRDDRKGA